MKIHFELGDIVFECERDPMPEGRFRALCSLAGAAIAGGVLLGAIALVGFWAIPWVVGALAMVWIVTVISK